ncbi:MAG: ATP-dependent Clp protease ATP-binding subunit ClpC, partial [Candidatus Omnitrophota bacterium]
DMKKMLLEEVKKTFKPEFLNRLDEITVFKPLGKKDLERIVDIEISYVNSRLIEQGFQVQMTPKAKEFFIERGFDPVFGARPLKRVIQRFLEDPLAEDIIKGRFKTKLQRKNEPEPVKVKAVRKGENLEFE